MTIIITARNGPLATNPTGFRPPVTRGLVGWWWLVNGDLDIARRNLAPGAGLALATVTGSPVATSDGVEFTSKSNFFDTGIADDTATVTLFAGSTASPAVATQVPFITAFGTGPDLTGSYGTLLQVRASTGSPNGQVAFGHCTNNGSGGTTLNDALLPSQAVTGPRLYVGKGTGTGGYTRDLTSLGAAVTNSTGAAVPNSSRNFLLGSVAGGGSVRESTGLFYAIYKVTLTVDEEETVAAFVKAYMLRRSITI